MKKMLIIMLVSFILISCSSNSPEIPPIKLDEVYVNKQIKLIAAQELNDFKTKDSVGLILEYNSENKILFPPNYNLRIFIKEDGKWLEIKEKPTIRPENDVVLSPDVPISYGQIVSFFPQIPDITKKYTMRAYVFGNMTTKEGTVQVGSFVDFILIP